MKSITINSSFDTPLTYLKTGSGPVVVLVNAYGVVTRLWDGVIAELQNSYTVLIWELRGMDDEHKPSEDFQFSVDQHAQDLGDILDSEAVESAHIVAWCSGAKVALRYQHDSPQRCKSLILISGNFSPFSLQPDCETEWDKNMLAATDLLMMNPAAQPFFFDAANTAIEAVMNGDTDVQGGRFGLLKMVSPKYISMIMNPMFNEITMVNYLNMINAYYKYDVSSLLDSIEVPLCLIWSASDHISHPEQSRLLSQKLDGVEAVVIPESNHYMVVEKSDQVAGQIDRFASLHQ